jgi:hypothetical protein
MRSIAEVVDSELIWRRPSATKMEYELRAGDETIATVRFRSMWGSFATGESADGCWTFKRVGFWQTRATIRPCGSDIDIATFRNNTWSGGGSLELSDGQKFLATTNFWQTNYEFQTQAAAPLFRLKSHGFLLLSAQLEILPLARSMPELPWMAMFGWYSLVMMHSDAGAAAAAV